MGVDTVIHFSCEPKDYFSTEGLIERLKGRDRAEAVIRHYRAQGDNRPTDQIGFETTRQTVDGTSETVMVIAADALKQAEELTPWEEHCKGCPANRTGQPFGCTGYINYPITTAGEIWLLQQLPDPETSLLPYLMMNKGMRQLGYTGEQARELRNRPGVFFENPDTLARKYNEEFMMTADQLFEMMFLVGPIQPAHGAMLLILLGGFPRNDMPPNMIMQLTRPDVERTADFEIPEFTLAGDTTGDASTRDLKGFLRSLYIAYKLNVPLLLDV